MGVGAKNMPPQNAAERVVIAFMDTWGPGPYKETIYRGFQQWLTDDIEWGNNETSTNGIEPVLTQLDTCFAAKMEYCTYDLHNIASRGDIVLTERTDHVHRADDSIIVSIPIMGAFKVRDGKLCVYH